MKAYERILAGIPANQTAARILVDLYRGTERWNRLLATLEGLLNGDVPAAERRAMLDEGRRITEQKLGSKSLAFQWANRALNTEPGDAELFKETERLGREADEWPALSAIYKSKVAAAADDTTRQEFLRKALDVELTRLRRGPETRSLAEQLLELSPADAQAEQALEAVFIREESWADLTKILDTRAARAGETTQARLDLSLNAARLEEEKLANQGAAVATTSRRSRSTATTARCSRRWRV